jgi:SAM-dependent methyltransferase
MNPTGATHQELILDQFTRQAIPFATAATIKDEDALKLVIEFCGVGADDTVLDVACGPGILACAFARVARHVTGIDITPAMLDRARVLQQDRKLTNLTWKHGDVLPLPFPDGSFSIVTSRFAFHHFLEPGRVLAEMRRVCAPGGKVVVIDTAIAPDKADAFNHMEKLRDPSHVRGLPLAEHLALFAAAGLPAPRISGYHLNSDLEGLLSRSFPNPGDAEVIRKLFVDSLPNDALGINARREGDVIRCHYPVAILVADR